MECRLKAARGERGWSQTKLHLVSGVPQTTISAIERGAMVPTVPVARALADALSCTIDDLFRQDDQTA